MYTSKREQVFLAIPAYKTFHDMIVFLDALLGTEKFFGNSHTEKKKWASYVFAKFLASCNLAELDLDFVAIVGEFTLIPEPELFGGCSEMLTLLLERRNYPVSLTMAEKLIHVTAAWSLPEPCVQYLLPYLHVKREISESTAYLKKFALEQDNLHLWKWVIDSGVFNKGELVNLADDSKNFPREILVKMVEAKTTQGM